MNSQSVDAIRMAFASGEFGKAQRLWSEYAVHLQRMITSRTATAAMMSEARELVKWSALTVKIHQSHAEHQLRGMFVAGLYHQAGAYQAAPVDQPASLRVCI